MLVQFCSRNLENMLSGAGSDKRMKKDRKKVYMCVEHVRTNELEKNPFIGQPDKKVYTLIENYSLFS